MTASLGKISTAMHAFRRWARQRGLDDDLRMSGVDRSDARERIQPDVARVLDNWRRPPAV